MKYRVLSSGTKYSSNANDAESTKAKLERNDCVVRAISVLFNQKYDTAHEFVKQIFKRQDKKAAKGVVLRMRELTEAFGRDTKELGIKHPTDEKRASINGREMIWPWKDKGVTKYAQYTVGKFLKDYPKGDYLIFIANHAFAIKDGVVFGNEEDALKLRVRVEQAFHII